MEADEYAGDWTNGHVCVAILVLPMTRTYVLWHDMYSEKRTIVVIRDGEDLRGNYFYNGIFPTNNQPMQCGLHKTVGHSLLPELVQSLIDTSKGSRQMMAVPFPHHFVSTTFEM
jgi:hypothetical protein